MADTETVKPELKEKTKYQLISSVISQDYLVKQQSCGMTFKKYRELAKDPTNNLAKTVLVGVLLSGSWSIEADEDVDDEIIEFIQKQIIPQRPMITQTVMEYADIVFGWQGFEKVFEEKDGKIVLKKLKPLLQDITQILVDKDTGAFLGFRQTDLQTGQPIDLPIEKSLLIPFRVEGTQWHGGGRLDNVISTQRMWDAANDGADRYDRKIAGSHFIVYYPAGVTLLNSVETDNGVIASELLKSLESSGSIAIPSSAAEYVDQLNKEAMSKNVTGWKIDILEDSGGRQPTFIQRLDYLDKLKVRGFGIPERAILEGNFGTKAEAGVHGDFLILDVQNCESHIVWHINWYVIDQLLALNYGEDMRGKVRVKAAPIVDEQITFLREVYKSILSSPSGFIEEMGQIDTDGLKDKLNIPKSKEVAQAGDDEDVKPPIGATPEELAKMEDKKQAFSLAADENWITVNGQHILIKEGQEPGDAIFEHLTQPLHKKAKFGDAVVFRKGKDVLSGIISEPDDGSGIGIKDSDGKLHRVPKDKLRVKKGDKSIKDFKLSLEVSEIIDIRPLMEAEKCF
jgi:hypothetical protein